MIPQKIWIAWHQGIVKAPEIVQTCIKSWKFHNPGWHIEIVEHERWHEYLPRHILKKSDSLPNLKPAHQADWLRLQLLNQHGGVWADATLLCRVPLESWLFAVLQQEFFAFSNPGPDRLLSNWFLASSASNPMIQAWSNRYEQLIKTPRPKWCPPIQKMIKRQIKQYFRNSSYAAQIWCNPVTQILTGHLPYFGHHYCFAEVLRTKQGMKNIWESVPYKSAIPCHWLQDHPELTQASINLPTTIDAPVFKLNRRVNTPDQKAIRTECLRFDEHQ